MAEIVGGPRDGEQFVVPGPLPPEKIKVLNTDGGPLRMWHPAHGTQCAIVVCELEDTVTANARPSGAWRYLWPKGVSRANA